MTTDIAACNESRSPHEIFRLLNEEHGKNVVTRALRHRKTATEGVRKQLNGALSDLRIPGFRSGSQAPPNKLLPATLRAIARGNKLLAHAVLVTWMDSHDALQQAAAAHLAERGIQTPEAGDAIFVSSWTLEKCRRERDAMTARDDTLDADDAELMLCLVSRRFPGPPRLTSPLFRGWREELVNLSPEAPEWPEIDAFTKWVHHLGWMKHLELLHWRVEEIEKICRDIRSRFDGDLRFLEVDPDPWSIAGGDRPLLADRILELARNLRDALEVYAPVRPQADTREKERQRARERDRCGEEVLRLVKEWNELLEQPDPAARPAPEAGEPADAPADDERTDAVGESPQARTESLHAEHERIQQQIDEARAELARIGEESRRLQSEQAQPDQEIQRLTDALADSQRKEEYWRRTYVDEKRKSRARTDDEPIAVNSVREAVAQAEETFRDGLLIKLNSQSNPDTPFKSPGEVFDILALLATADRKALGEQIGTTCAGWFYRSSQSVTTMGENRQWYETRVNGRTWKLANHVGKGSSHDPRNTIRIAFAWDETNDRVIVGFVGMHQRNRQS